MKTIGLLGGMSWESSVEYERMINQGIRAQLGGGASADLIVRSYNFADIEALQQRGAWDEVGAMLAKDARLLVAAGAELMVLCTNTMHIVADRIEAAIEVPFLHLGDTTAAAVQKAKLRTVGLLGTRYTMEKDFYRGRLESHGLAVVVPNEPDRTMIHDVIYGELVRGVVTDESKAAYVAAIDRLVARGAEGIIAGCTEIELLVTPSDLAVPYFPTTRLHADAAVAAALQREVRLTP
ncbi:MAG: aspartate/glutamate racemase family protein [Acidimicrobiales bacterium]|nr:aspartate/glutamate racemase family protein [Acidimicrobiales bacterium]